jgi:hypothetical protein
MVFLATKNVNLIFGFTGLDHSIFSKVVCWTFPVYNTTIKLIYILLLECLFFFGDKQNDIIGIFGSYIATGYSLISAITPNFR